MDFPSIIFNRNTVTNDLLKSSFGVDYSNYKNYDMFLRSIIIQIEMFMADNNRYPNANELKEITIYRDIKPVKISEIIDSIDYNLSIDGKSFNLNYKNTIFTIDEAKKELEKVGLKNVEYKDYKKLIGNKEIKNIPEVYKMIPNDSIFFHVNNPEFLFNLLEEDTSYQTSGVEIMKKARDLIVEKAGLESFEEIKKSITHDFTVVISDLDLTSPNILIILDKRDKGFLGVVTPGSKPKATITKGDHILIANSKELLDKYQELNEKDSIYNSDDFRYVWMKKQDVKKDVFFFAGDKFFEKLISFENYIKMKRKINDYFNLKELQNFAFAYQNITKTKLNNFSELNKVLKISPIQLLEYEVKDSIVKSKTIGKVDDLKNIDEIEYDLNKITREELESYKQNILNYREIWRASLDPLGVVFSGTSSGFEIDFFMTPIPEMKGSEINILKTIFEDLGAKKLDFIENKSLRIGTIGGVFGIEVDKLKERFKNVAKKENNENDWDYSGNELFYFKQTIEQFNKEVLNGNDIFDYFDGEIMLSIAGIDNSIFTSYNTEKLDAFLALEFKSNLKAKEFVKLLRDKMAEFSKNLISDNSMGIELSKHLIKPLSEDYNGEIIYSIPKIDLYYIKPSFYYTILDKYFYISLSKDSIKKTIDFYKNKQNKKQKFIDNNLTGNKTLFMFLDSIELRNVIDNILNENYLVDLYVEFKGNNFRNSNLLRNRISSYYSKLENNKLLGKKLPKFYEKFGMLTLQDKNGEIYLSIDKNELNNIKNQKFKTDIIAPFDQIDKKYFTKEGADISLLLKDKVFDDLFAVASLNMILDKKYRDSFFTNMTSFIDISDNEIQIKFNSFSDEKKEKSIGSKMSNIFDIAGKFPTFLIFIIIILTIIPIIWGIFIYKNTNHNNNSQK